jgi:hypothetical protein
MSVLKIVLTALLALCLLDRPAKSADVQIGDGTEMTRVPFVRDLWPQDNLAYFLEQREWFETLMRKLNGQGIVESSLIAQLLVNGERE